MRTHRSTLICLTVVTLGLLSCGEESNQPQSAPAGANDISAEKIEESLVAAERYFDGDKLIEAEIILKELIDRAPQTVAAHEMLARVIFTGGSKAQQAYRFAEAQSRFTASYEQYERVIELEPDHAGWRQNAGDFALMAGRPNDAIAQYLEAERLDPANPRHPLYQAQVLLQQNRIDEADEAVQRALMLDGASAHALATLATIQFERGAPHRAFETIADAQDVAREDDAVSFRVIEARFSRLTGDPKRSVQLLSTLNAADRANLAAAEELALAYAALDQQDNSLKTWTHAYDLTHDWRAAVGAAETCAAAGKPMQAETWLNVAAAVVGDDHARIKDIRAGLNRRE